MLYLSYCKIRISANMHWSYRTSYAVLFLFLAIMVYVVMIAYMRPSKQIRLDFTSMQSQRNSK